MNFDATPRSLLVFLVAACLWAAAANVRADQVWLTDGSKLVGMIGTLDEKVLVIETELLGTLEIAAQSVAGIETDGSLRVVLADGTELTGRLVYSPDTGQRLVGTASGEERDAVKVIGISPPTGDEPRLARAQTKSPWSGRLRLGLSGSSGNSERFRIHGRAELDREGETDRLKLYASGDLDESDGETTAEQVLVGGRLEHDFGERLFGFLRQDLERDEVESIDLRSTSLVGVGYFAIRSPTLVWKPRAGVGYEYEKPTQGTSNDSILSSLGWSFEHERAAWLRITHDFDYLPKVDDPFSDYRLVSDLGAVIPLAGSEEWSVRFGLRHKYDSMPEPGIERLDTTYDASLVYMW